LNKYLNTEAIHEESKMNLLLISNKNLGGNYMSVIDIDKVDGIGIHKDGFQLALLLCDHLDWANEYDHLIQLQNKINSYIGFIESRQYEKIYEDYNISSFNIEIHFLYQLIENCQRFLDTVNMQLREKQIIISY